MAKLKTATRNKLPKGDFAGPGKSFPIENASHARAAISGATRSERAGNISASEEAAIKSKARKKLGTPERGYPHEGGGAGGGLAVDKSMENSGIHDTHHRRKY